jgi:hypothetical protein
VLAESPQIDCSLTFPLASKRPLMMTNINEAFVLRCGLAVGGFSPQRRAARTELRRFKGLCGALPKSCVELWNDLHTTSVGAACIPEAANVDHLFWALLFLKECPTESPLAGRLGKDEKAVRKWVLHCVVKISLLKPHKIIWNPQEESGGDGPVFTISVDGVDCRIQEPAGCDPTWFSRKFKGPAAKCEMHQDRSHCVDQWSIPRQHS